MTRGWLASLAIAVAASAAVAADPPEQPAGEAAEAQRQVLVLLRLPAPHFRPDASYAGGYDAPDERAIRRRIAAEIAARQHLRLIDDWPMPMLGLDCFVMTVPGDRATDEAAAALAQDARVEWAQPMHLFRGRQPRDPLYPTQPVAKAWQLSALHALATGRDVRVAVVDSAVEMRHPDLAGRIALHENFVAGADPDSESHGTAVAGIIAANAGNGVGIVGVAPGATLMTLRACWQASAADTLCSSLSLAKAVYFAVRHGADVVNLSLGGPQDRLLARLLDLALARGVTVVAALDRSAPATSFPASHPGVVAVADDGPGELPPGVLRAPGSDVPTTAPGARWALVSGASYAAAHVTGLYALMRELWHANGAARGTTVTLRGGGEVDACATLARMTGPIAPTCTDARAERRAQNP